MGGFLKYGDSCTVQCDTNAVNLTIENISSNIYTCGDNQQFDITPQLKCNAGMFAIGGFYAVLSLLYLPFDVFP